MPIEQVKPFSFGMYTEVPNEFFVLFSKSDWKKSLGVVLLSLLVISNFGLVDRFSSERETEGIQDRIQMQTATAGFLSNSEPLELAFGNGFNNIGVVNGGYRRV